MLGFLFLLINSASSYTDEEVDKLVLKPAFLSDFVNARQLRNLTLIGQQGMAPINGQYYTKPMFSLLQSLQPTYLQVRSMLFKSFDGMIVQGEARGIAKFADVIIYECEFTDGNANVMHVKGPGQDINY